METIFQEPRHHYAPFSEDSVILIQLILTEFIQTHQTLLQILSIFENPNPVNMMTLNAENSLFNLLNQLLGQSSYSNPPSIFSSHSNASLKKLKNYCESYSHQSLSQNKHARRLYYVVHRTWLATLNQLERLQIIHLRKSKSPSVLIKEQHKQVQLIVGRFNQVIKTIPLMIHPYLNNENILLYLLRHKDPLIQIYGNQTFSKQFKWPINPMEMKTLLDNRYQSRGFNSLLPLIKQMFLQEEVSLDVS
ncbi:MAG: hypothetical protein Q8K60_03110 [Parachlamydiaceae bacterium]|nr:hypothetical protein [Parachlamydiaceae bacterium]